jgi:hypothetical protein
MKDNFTFWEPGKGITENKYLEGINDGYEGLVIFLKEMNQSEKVLKISFNTYLTFRTSNESYRLKTLSLNHQFVNGINVSYNSEFLDWFKSETHHIYDESSPVHYLICTNDDITDVISFNEPVLEWVS